MQENENTSNKEVISLVLHLMGGENGTRCFNQSQNKVVQTNKIPSQFKNCSIQVEWGRVANLTTTKKGSPMSCMHLTNVENKIKL